MTSQTYPEALQKQLDAIVSSCPLVPVITIDRPEDALPLGKALVEGGVRILEITLRTPHALQAITDLRAALPEVWVGVGTVATVEQFKAAEDAGAQFVITPGSTKELLEYGLTAKIPMLPGVSSLSEVMEGYRLGYRAFKFFPAEVAGGVSALKAFSGPFPNVKFCPTGGITREKAKDYLALPNVLAVGGSWLTPKDAISAGDWRQIRTIAEESLAAI
ncbi:MULTISPECIES: bifunctional 4-hydroxy-2-oxoglutarate aldolase/2-dehydro-3-deoxy-phosphogluconate aldolase [unclassified Hahella]|uniref:bifunctional 4-hydroxy-2-oxoglutarate aldolase/2-dehydro-3-deoxy-phosphogluconate aldolase n=1 Tax=unclassified Hahella TaxID=2624107 RepID=UPI000FDE30D9|nr:MULTISPECIES: bifunctional 4-hydroxy-2-oxoglutarate aldolase/2-dehydro-3-deoxy-phosphogluconate aldolase [unclassified Hahella]AZZ89945.1 bifunctional 4-hydroxy-2-oxoglutarate aldolase/2-dehydro-3-deoxy-phosphogluconate aldolase [Hahella sp. KA22]MBU6954212.1 bifunctional 4-hydroxy-2-oxoglutarate aldolase/2-dehydro-3-deoxy-phosphogluconate aldolase [Hahella sp. HN01]MDG9666164.1 bifunctional 4-hydroxy-2-oxoglutarate aldolase/2-dehydro-3-deoxy-phosphogluconate aldolase [Hahella sp. CR1]QAY533